MRVKAFTTDEASSYFECMHRLKKANQFKSKYPEAFIEKPRLREEYSKIRNFVASNYERFVLWVITENKRVPMQQEVYEWVFENNKFQFEKAYKSAMNGEEMELIKYLDPVRKLVKAVSIQ